jgi:glycine reductase
MRLELEYFDVRDIQFGDTTEWSGGVLRINRDALIGLLSSDDRLKVTGIELARPGEPVRITNVNDVIEPRIKKHVASYFPGMLDWLEPAGTGVTQVLRGAAVVEVGSIRGFYGNMIDMSGEGAGLTPFSRFCNVCVVTEPAAGVQPLEYGLAMKQAGLKASVYLAGAAAGMTPDETEVFDLRSNGGDASLPKLGYLFQLHSHGDLREPFVYGYNSRRYYPTILHPNEVLDGAVVCGHYDISGSLKNYTFGHLNHPVIRDLYRRHGKELDFRGVVIAPEPVSMTEIKRTSMMAAGLLKNILGVDGVVITKEGGGHTDVDLMQNCDECEKLGIKTVIIDNEWLGPDGSGEFPLLALSSNADAMVSVGNIDAVIDLPAMERVIGGLEMIDFPGRLDGKLHIPLRVVANAISQLGLTYLTTEAH